MSAVDESGKAVELPQPPRCLPWDTMREWAWGSPERMRDYAAFLFFAHGFPKSQIADYQGCHRKTIDDRIAKVRRAAEELGLGSLLASRTVNGGEGVSY